MGDNNLMIKLCVFDTFEECKEAEQYDHNYQKAISLAGVTGVDINIIRDNNLHIPADINILRDKYINDSVLDSWKDKFPDLNELELMSLIDFYLFSEYSFFALDQYLLDNSIVPLTNDDYEDIKKYWLITTNWSVKYKIGNQYCYFMDHSDRIYNIIEVEDLSTLIPLDEEGNEIINQE